MAGNEGDWVYKITVSPEVSAELVMFLAARDSAGEDRLEVLKEGSDGH